MGERGVWTHAASMSAAHREAVGMPVPGARLTLATLLGAADAIVVESVEGDVVVLSDGSDCTRAPGRARGSTTASASGTSRSASASATSSRPEQARLALHLDDRMPARRGAPAAARPPAAWRPPPAARATPRLRPGRPCSTSRQGGLALRAGVTYGAGDLIDVELDDGTGAVISARLEIVDLIADDDGGVARGRIVAIADDGAQRLGALVDRLRDSPGDAAADPAPQAALREAMAAARRLQR